MTRPPGGAPAHEWFAAGLRPGAHARLLVTLVLYAAGAGVLALSPPVGLAVPVAVGLGFLLATALPVMHEAAHGHLGASPGVDRAVGTAAGAAILAAFPCYREVHLAPHDHLGGDGDAEIPCPVTSVATYLSLLSPRYFLIPFWGETLRALRGQRGAEARRVARRVVVPALALVLAATWLWPVTMAWAYWLPLWACGAWMFVTTVHEHHGSTDDTTVTRSIACSRVMAWFLWNTHLHEAHHDTPWIAFDALPHDGGGAAQLDRDHPSFLAYHFALLRGLPLFARR